uniref:Myoneurin n=1 Tax=Phallusia mammillata TaxID=59560 RepID=A0A6F9DLS6_9ASCI|nr:myoneurin [Phallusia mammillata]
MLYVSPNFGGKTLQTLNEMRKNERFCDITIAIGSYKFPAHKSVLVANSPYMAQEIEKLHGKTLTIGLTLSNPAVFAELLNFLYLGEIELTQEKLAEVMLLASFLQISEILKITSEFVRAMQSANTSINNNAITDNIHSDAEISDAEQMTDDAGNTSLKSSNSETSAIQQANTNVLSSTSNAMEVYSTPSNALNSSMVEKSPGQFNCSGCKMVFTNQLDRAMHTVKYCKNRKKMKNLLQKKKKSGRLEIQTTKDDDLETYGNCIEMYIEHVENESVKKFCRNLQGKKRKCLACDFECAKMVEFRRHVTQHTGDTPFGCRACGKAFKRSDILKAHLLRSTRNSCGQYLVDHKGMFKDFNVTPTSQLTKKFESLVSSTLEVFSTGENFLNFKCNKCIEEFESFEEFFSHRKDEHDIVEEIKCPICKLVFGKESWLDAHLEYHRTKPNNTMTVATPVVKTKVFQCILCEDVFRTEDAYELHRRKNCANCCRFCKRVCKSRYHLDRHVRSHIKDKPYKCPVCHRSFKHHERLDIHVKAKHSMTMPKDIRQAQAAHVIEILDELSTELLDEMGIGGTTELPQ